MLTGRRCGGTPARSAPSSRMRPCVRRLEAGEHAQQRGLAATRRAEQREEFAAEDVERQVLDRADAETLADALEPHQRPRGRIGPGREIAPRAGTRRVCRSPAWAAHAVSAISGPPRRGATAMTDIAMAGRDQFSEGAVRPPARRRWAHQLGQVPTRLRAVIVADLHDRARLGEDRASGGRAESGRRPACADIR